MTEQDVPHGRNAALSLIQTMIGELWDKARDAATLIEQLRSDNNSLSKRVAELETSLHRSETQLTERNQLIEELQKQPEILSTVDVGERLLYLAPDEREALERQINDLLARINAHLGSHESGK